jgi:phage terminase small subunit
MLKIKQEKFCQELVMCGSQSEAYRVAYDSENMQPATIHSRASELMKNSKVIGLG